MKSQQRKIPIGDADGESNDFLVPEWLRGKRQNWIATGILWAAAATIYWLDPGITPDTGDLVVGGVFAALALYSLTMAFVDAPPSPGRGPRLPLVVGMVTAPRPRAAPCPPSV